MRTPCFTMILMLTPGVAAGSMDSLAFSAILGGVHRFDATDPTVAMGTDDLAPNLVRRLSEMVNATGNLSQMVNATTCDGDICDPFPPPACDGSDICDPFPPPACDGSDICDPFPTYVDVSFVASGDVSDYGTNTQVAISSVIASAAHVDQSAVALTVQAASVRVTAAIQFLSSDVASTAVGSLATGIFSDTYALEAALAAGGVPINVESIASLPAITSAPYDTPPSPPPAGLGTAVSAPVLPDPVEPDPPESSDDSDGLSDGAIVGIVLGGIFLLFCTIAAVASQKQDKQVKIVGSSATVSSTAATSAPSAASAASASSKSSSYDSADIEGGVAAESSPAADANVVDVPQTPTADESMAHTPQSMGDTPTSMGSSSTYTKRRKKVVSPDKIETLEAENSALKARMAALAELLDAPDGEQGSNVALKKALSGLLAQPIGAGTPSRTASLDRARAARSSATEVAAAKAQAAWIAGQEDAEARNMDI